MKVTLSRPIPDPTPSQGYDDRVAFVEVREYEVEGALLETIKLLQNEIFMLRREVISLSSTVRSLALNGGVDMR